jgi:hypothetical protein
MDEKSDQMKICPNCGSTRYFEDYPVLGVSICEICGHQVTSTPVKEVDEEIEERVFSKCICRVCGRNQTDDLLLDSERLVVFKCKGCGQLDAYRISPIAISFNEDIYDAAYSSKAAAIAKKEGHLVFSASASEKIVKAIQKKQKDPVIACQKELERFICEKSHTLLEKGISCCILERADIIASRFIALKGPLTSKQVACLFSGAVYLVQDYLSSKEGLKGRMITEIQGEEIFGVSRKTSRKWVKMLKKEFPAFA